MAFRVGVQRGNEEIWRARISYGATVHRVSSPHGAFPRTIKILSGAIFFFFLPPIFVQSSVSIGLKKIPMVRALVAKETYGRYLCRFSINNQSTVDGLLQLGYLTAAALRPQLGYFRAPFVFIVLRDFRSNFRIDRSDHCPWATCFSPVVVRARLL